MTGDGFERFERDGQMWVGLRGPEGELEPVARVVTGGTRSVRDYSGVMVGEASAPGTLADDEDDRVDEDGDTRPVRDRVLADLATAPQTAHYDCTDAVLATRTVAEALAAQERVTAALALLDAVDPAKSATVMVSAVRRALTGGAP